MSVLVREWLRADPAARVVALDVSPPMRRLNATSSRWPPTDARDCGPDAAEQWHTALKDHDITHIAHGATVTPISRGSWLSSIRSPKRRIRGVSSRSTPWNRALLEWARRCRICAVSLPSARAGSIRSTGRIGPASPSRGRLCDAAASLRHFQAGRRAHHRTLWRSVPPVTLRAALVGLRPMDRLTQTRNYRHVPTDCAARAQRRRLRARQHARCIGDYVTSRMWRVRSSRSWPCPDCATAATTLPRTNHSIRDIVGWRRRKCLDYAEVVAPELADVLQDANAGDGMWGAYDISRICAETPWRRATRARHACLHDWLSPSGVPTSRLPPAAAE